MSQEQITQETVPVAETTNPTTEAPKQKLQQNQKHKYNNNQLLLSLGKKLYQKN